MSQERLAALVKGFSRRCQELDDGSYTQSGALAQLWVPKQLSGGERLTTQGAPFAVMGFSDQLALYRYHAGKYQPLCSSINEDTKCAISRVYAHLPPDDTGSSSAADGEFNRTAAAQLANIHSELLLAIYDEENADEDEWQQKPTAVFELALHEVEVDFAPAVKILSEVAEDYSFYIPSYNPALPRKSVDIPISLRGGVASSANSSSAAHSAATPAGFCSASWFESNMMSAFAGRGQQQQQQHRPPVIYTEHYKYNKHECARQPAASALRATAATPPPPATAGGPFGQRTRDMRVIWESMDSQDSATPPTAKQQQQQQHVQWALPQSQLHQQLSPAHVPASSLNGAAAQARQQLQQQQQQQLNNSGSHARQQLLQQLQQQQSVQQQMQQQQQIQQQQQQQMQQQQQDLQDLQRNWSFPQQRQQPQLKAQWSQPQLHQQQQQLQPPQPAGWWDLQQQQQQPSASRENSAPLSSLAAWQPQQQQADMHSGWSAMQPPMGRLSMANSMPLPALAQRRLSGDTNGSLLSAAGDRVRALVTVGGCFRHKGGAGAVEYVGGAQKVVSILRSVNYDELLSILGSRVDSGSLGGRHLQVKYGLPGAAGVFIDVTSDDDIAAMWEEWDEYTMNLSHSSTSSNPATGSARLQLFVDASCGSGRSSGGSDASNSRYMAGGSGRSSYSEFGHNRLPPGRSRSSTNLGVGVNMLQLQPSTPSTDRSSSNTLAQAAALLTFQTSVRTVPSADSDISVAGGAQTFVPFFGNAKSAPHSPLNSIRGGVMGCVGEGAGEAVGGYSNDPLDLLAVLASEKAPTLGSARDAQDEGQVQQRKRAVRRSVTEPGLKMLVRQLQAQVEVIAPEDLEIVRFIGGGAFGEVYLAKWHSTEVAVKCLAPSLLACNSSTGGASTNNSMSSTASSKAATELMQEAAILARMRHPNIVSVFGVVLPPRDMVGALSFEVDLPQEGSCDGNDLQKQGWMPDRVGHVSGPAVVCEYLSAGSLQNAIRSGAEWLKGKMAKVKVMLDTAKGLSYLHSKSMVHFDLKSGNLLFTIKDRVPTVKVADFGLSKRRHQTYVTGVDSMRGTLPWIAPEIIKNPNNVTEAADVYSYGVIMWELWTHKEPFEGVHLHALLHQLTMHGSLSLPVPGSHEWGDEEVPPEPAPGWCDLMQRCWSHEPAARPTSKQLVAEMEGMMAALKRAK